MSLTYNRTSEHNLRKVQAMEIPSCATLMYSLRGRKQWTRHTWATIVETLESPIVEENKLAMDMWSGLPSDIIITRW